MCTANIDPDDLTGSASLLGTSAHCVLGDFSSAWDKTADSLYTGGPSRAEQTDEYAPPESFFDEESPWLLSPAFDSWSIGIVALELLLGTPNVFTVDQRTKALLTHKLRSKEFLKMESRELCICKFLLT
jgi:serine/threonine protein kinase